MHRAPVSARIISLQRTLCACKTFLIALFVAQLESYHLNAYVFSLVINLTNGYSNVLTFFFFFISILKDIQLFQLQVMRIFLKRGFIFMTAEVLSSELSFRHAMDFRFRFFWVIKETLNFFLIFKKLLFYFFYFN